MCTNMWLWVGSGWRSQSQDHGHMISLFGPARDLSRGHPPGGGGFCGQTGGFGIWAPKGAPQFRATFSASLSPWTHTHLTSPKSHLRALPAPRTPYLTVPVTCSEGTLPLTAHTFTPFTEPSVLPSRPKTQIPSLPPLPKNSSSWILQV